MHHFLLFARKRKSYAISEFEFFKVPFTTSLALVTRCRRHKNLRIAGQGWKMSRVTWSQHAAGCNETASFSLLRPTDRAARPEGRRSTSCLFYGAFRVIAFVSRPGSSGPGQAVGKKNKKRVMELCLLSGISLAGRHGKRNLLHNRKPLRPSRSRLLCDAVQHESVGESRIPRGNVRPAGPGKRKGWTS